LQKNSVLGFEARTVQMDTLRDRETDRRTSEDENKTRIYQNMLVAMLNSSSSSSSSSNNNNNNHALNDCIFRALGLQESLPVKNHLVWFALMVNGQMVALLFHGAAARPLRGMSQ